MTRPHLWIRAEARPGEQRVAIVPADAQRLVADGYVVTVEESPSRVIDLEDYVAAGCSVAPYGSWVDAPEGAVVVGIKELPQDPADLTHTHVFFAHAYKGQEGADVTLERFRRGGGELLDVEYLTLDGRRVVAFGFWAGYVGAALAVLRHRGLLDGAVAPMGREELDGQLRESADGHEPERALVIGSRGRSGRGAVEALELAGCAVTRWDRGDTVELDKAALLDHDILVNCVVSSTPQQPFVGPDDVTAPRRLRTIGDVTCDVTSDNNLLPVNTAITTWPEPVRQVGTADAPLEVIAIDNLPSLLPLESSMSFSAELTPLLEDLAERRGPWAASLEWFRRHVPLG
ncbi:Saccharopine dehydrogenase [NAD+, L-lysine-forming] [Serinicoccus hydrothermalis]|uniref:Saccharopine dehydrogenase [NAD+, L-lysine-forming] n=1 Tax=Serinicoccus hydrothermalis TaxID=1758689 RepID=A0A1B1NDP4_9MICO|nr:saccharopine dehydrogenase [Serinicoccus hydrothermalis]ANS79568.1 Saccharopine dehydrogenase [NAD+, L-lysine-forming] [Serinicoccus hydrothermalis]